MAKRGRGGEREVGERGRERGGRTVLHTWTYLKKTATVSVLCISYLGMLVIGQKETHLRIYAPKIHTTFPMSRYSPSK